MSNRITYQDNILTAKKFVQIGTDSVSARRQLNDILLAYKEIDNSLAFKEVEKMVRDNSITPDEKLELKARWETVSSAYTRLLQSLENSGLSGVYGVEDLKGKYAEVYVLMEQIFTDMESATETPIGFLDKWNALQEQLDIVSQTYSNLAYKVQEYKLRLETNHYYLGVGETAVITATLYKGLTAYTGEYLDEIMATIQWEVHGLTNPSQYISGTTVSVPYAAFDQSFYLSATVSIPIEDL